jgi:hypothetical protein
VEGEEQISLVERPPEPELAQTFLELLSVPAACRRFGSHPATGCPRPAVTVWGRGLAEIEALRLDLPLEGKLRAFLTSRPVVAVEVEGRQTAVAAQVRVAEQMVAVEVEKRRTAVAAQVRVAEQMVAVEVEAGMVLRPWEPVGPSLAA